MFLLFVILASAAENRRPASTAQSILVEIVSFLLPWFICFILLSFVAVLFQLSKRKVRTKPCCIVLDQALEVDMTTFIERVRPHVIPKEDKVFLTVGGQGLSEGNTYNVMQNVWQLCNSKLKVGTNAIRHMLETMVSDALEF